MMGPVLGMLKSSGVDYTYVNIHEDDLARQRVREINNGNESVPTLVFPDGHTLTEPGAGQLKAHLERVGYRVPLLAVLSGNALNIVFGLLILFFILRVTGVL